MRYNNNLEVAYFKDNNTTVCDNTMSSMCTTHWFMLDIC